MSVCIAGKSIQFLINENAFQLNKEGICKNGRYTCKVFNLLKVEYLLFLPFV